MVWLPEGENNFEDMFIPFDRMYERDRHTDRRTPHNDWAALAQHRAAVNRTLRSMNALILLVC